MLYITITAYQTDASQRGFEPLKHEVHECKQRLTSTGFSITLLCLQGPAQWRGFDQLYKKHCFGP